MGRVKIRKIKVLAKEVIEKFPDKVSADFELNKLLVSQVLIGQVSKKIRNKVAGYITRLVRRELEKELEEIEAVEAAESSD
ncbi:MAG: 30S ribosomal protein S17e [Aigarchaeota archaeon]|nr:30S ribosomal protein S17e [Candidatus Wolframiiraptor gerlachensis]